MRSEIDVINVMSCSITSRLAPVLSRIRCSNGPSASVSRWAMPEDGSSNRITVGSWASTQQRSTMRRLPVESSDTNLLANACSPINSMSSSTRRPILRSESRTTGSRSAAAIGSRTST